MPSSFTPSLRLVLPQTGEQDGTWGDLVNAGLTNLVEDAIAGSTLITMPDADLTLTVGDGVEDQSRYMFLTFQGSFTGPRNVICPSVSKLYYVTNAIVGGGIIEFRTLSGTGVAIAPGQRAAVYCDGTNVLLADTSVLPRSAASAVGFAVLGAANAAAARAALEAPSASDVTTALALKLDDSQAGAVGLNVLAATTQAAARAAIGVTPSGGFAASLAHRAVFSASSITNTPSVVNFFPATVNGNGALSPFGFTAPRNGYVKVVLGSVRSLSTSVFLYLDKNGVLESISHIQDVGTGSYYAWLVPCAANDRFNLACATTGVSGPVAVQFTAITFEFIE